MKKDFYLPEWKEKCSTWRDELYIWWLDMSEREASATDYAIIVSCAVAGLVFGLIWRNI